MFFALCGIRCVALARSSKSISPDSILTLQELWNWSMHAHTIHLHMVPFEIVGRYSMMNPDMRVFPTCPWEAGLKDIVVVLPGQVTKIKMRFDRPGLSVWHCHLLSHEDNQMMLPYCVGEMGVDCPM